MPAPQPPLILADNVFDRINLYPTAILSSTGAAAGTDVRHIADYRRERSQWKAATNAADRDVRVDLGAGNSRIVDAVWLDRGHNLWGLTVRVDASDAADFSTGDGLQWVVPAYGTVGGDPTIGWCVTEEGALYTLFAAFAARRYFRVRVVSAAQPILTGVILGPRAQLIGFASERDEDGGERSENSVDSDAMHTGSARVYHRRTLNLPLDLISAAEYDSTIRGLRAILWERDQPAVIVPNYGTHPERAWLYKYIGRQFRAPMTNAHRKFTLPMREWGPAVR